MTPSPQPRPAFRKLAAVDWLIILGLVLACFVAFGRSVSGDFVYDDTRQIVDNPLVKEPGYFWTALSSDVWAFRDASGEPGSNYWRPTFTLWNIVNHRLFGVENTAGWHIANIALHALVTLFAFGLLRFLGLGRALAGVIALIHAVHPVRTESVAWISGSPDLLMAATLIPALWLALVASRNGGWTRHSIALILLALSLGAKEVAIVFPLLLLAILVMSREPDSQDRPQGLTRTAGVCAPYFLLAAGYFLLRLEVVGEFTLEDATEISLSGVIVTAPGLFIFYLRQSLLPLWLSPVYSFQVVEPSALTLMNFWIPGIASVLALAALAWCMRKGKVQLVGGLVFMLTLLPAFNINAFIADHLVHDRYLYLPLLGLMMVLVPALASFGGHLLRNAGSAGPALGYGLAILACMALTAASVEYSRVWRNELALWEYATRVEPGAAFSWSMYGLALSQSGQDREAMVALNRSLESGDGPSTPWSLLARSEIYLRRGSLREAAVDLNLVIRGSPDNVRAYEQLALVYQQAGSLQDAARVLMLGRQQVAHHRCEFTVNLAVLQYLGGQKQEALEGLESIRGEAQTKPTPGCRLGLFRLGQLYIESGREQEGRELIRDYLAATQSYNDEVTLKYRASARATLSG